MDVIKTGKPTLLGAISGAVAGLVVITPAAGFVTVWASIVLGFTTSIISYLAVAYLKPKLGYDDALDVFGIHGISGAWGAIGTGIFAAPFVNSLGTGALYGNIAQLGIQCVDIVTVGLYSFIMTLIIGYAIKKTIGLRVEEKEEIEGLDTNQHEESGYRV
jgi:ammonium transporter, Amt family